MLWYVLWFKVGIVPRLTWVIAMYLLFLFFQNLLDSHLIKDSDESSETADTNKVFYLKMKGDYFRYLAEINNADKDGEWPLSSLTAIASCDTTFVLDYVSKSKEAYDRAFEESKKLPATDPIRLGLALNFSVFYYEIDNNPSKATELAKKVSCTIVKPTLPHKAVTLLASTLVHSNYCCHS